MGLKQIILDRGAKTIKQICVKCTNKQCLLCPVYIQVKKDSGGK
jgi:hypothetical protein